MEAYFNDTKPTKESPYFKNLIKSINKKYGFRFLQDTDDAIDIYGIESLIEEIKSDES